MQDHKPNFFDHLTSDERDALFKHGDFKKFKKNNVIFKKGDNSNYFFYLKSGVIKLILYNAQGQEIIIKLLYPRDIAGELSFLDNVERSAYAIAQTDCEIIVFLREKVWPIFEDNPYITIKLATYLASLLRQNTMRIESLVSQSVMTRLAKALLMIHSTESSTKNDIKQIYNATYKLTQNDYANLIAASRENVNRCLKLFEDNGLIMHTTKGIKIINIKELRILAGEEYE